MLHVCNPSYLGDGDHFGGESQFKVSSGKKLVRPHPNQ
jgi:hypothetical protein